MCQYPLNFPLRGYFAMGWLFFQGDFFGFPFLGTLVLFPMVIFFGEIWLFCGFLFVFAVVFSLFSHPHILLRLLRPLPRHHHPSISPNPPRYPNPPNPLSFFFFLSKYMNSPIPTFELAVGFRI